MMEKLSIDYTLLIANTTNVTSLYSIQFNKVIMGVLYQFQSISWLIYDFLGTLILRNIWISSDHVILRESKI